MSPTIRDKYKYFHSTVQRVKDRRQKFHFCRLPFDVRSRNVKLNLFVDVMFQEVYSKTQEEDSSTGIAEVVGSNAAQSLKIFSRVFFHQ